MTNQIDAMPNHLALQTSLPYAIVKNKNSKSNTISAKPTKVVVQDLNFFYGSFQALRN